MKFSDLPLADLSDDLPRTKEPPPLTPSVQILPGRRPGQRNEDLSGEPTSVMLKKAKSLIRVDLGGHDQDATIRKKAAEVGLQFTGPQLDFIKDLCSKQVEGCRKRIYPRIDEAIRRAMEQEASEAS